MLGILKKFFKFCNNVNRRKFYLSIFLGVIEAIFSSLKIPAIYLVIDAILKGNDLKETALQVFLLMVLSVVGASVVKYFSTMLQCEGGYNTCAEKRMDIAKHLRYVPMGYFNSNSLEGVTSVTTNTLQNLENVATRVVMLVTGGIITTFVILVMMFIFNIYVGLSLLVGILLYYAANTLLQRKAKAISNTKVNADTKLVENVLEYISGIEEVKAYSLTGIKSKELNKANDESVRVNTKMEMAVIPFMTLQNFLAKLSGVLMTLVAILLYIKFDGLSLLNTIIIIISSFMIYSSLETSGNYSTLLKVVDLSVDKVNEILETKTMDINGSDIKPSNYDIAINNIKFSYDKKTIIDGIDAQIGEKTTTAIVGPSGSGKTTLANLIARFFDVDNGNITLGGHDIKEYSMDSLMKNFSFVFQDVYLFKDTIANNIRFSNPNASMEEVKEAAKKACCDKFIEGLKDGYDTIIDENGGNLSGGERQRISIARAIMKNSPIVILDEATANVDPENEEELVKAINELTKDKTIIMIAHRLKTVKNANQILVINKGEIVQRGTHEQLIKDEGIYKDFVQNRKIAASWKL